MKPVTEYLQAKLNGEYRGKHSFLSRETGVSQATISRCASGKNSSTLDSIEPLLVYFGAEIVEKK